MKDEIGSVSKQSNFPGIESTPGVAGGELCVGQTRIPVWLLVQAKQVGASDGDILRSYPVLTAADLENAWAYHQSHQDEIDQQIVDQETA